MDNSDKSPIHASTENSMEINNRHIETMELAELDDAIAAVALLTQAIKQRRAQLNNAAAEIVNSDQISDFATEPIDEPFVTPADKAKAELQRFYELPMGKAILRALSNAYQNPGTTHSITNPEKPLPKDGLAALIKKLR